MNHTQKGAIFTLLTAVLLIAFGIVVFAAMFVPGDRLEGVGVVKLWSGVIVLFLAVSLVCLHRRRNAGEPDSDERDNSIKKNAVLACFVALWISLAALALAPSFIVGENGSIPVSLLPIVNTGIMLFAMIVYSVAILVQYGRTIDGEEV